VTDAPNLYQKARSDVAGMLGYDLVNLTPEQSMRVDVASALRVLLDTQSGRLVRGESLDARELLMASEALSRLLPPAVLATPPAEQRDDHESAIAPLRKLYRYLHERVAELETENAHLKAALGAGHLQHKGEAENCDSGHLCGSVPPADVVPPSEYLGVPPMRGPDDPQRRSTRVIELNIAFLINSSRRCAQKNYDQRLFHTRCGSAQPRSPLPPVASAPGKSWTRWFPKP
jgi:hypothetical protein